MKKLFSLDPTRKLFISSGFAVVVAVVVTVLLSMERDIDDAPAKTVPVLVTKRYIAAPAMVDAECCVERRIPEVFAPPRPLLKRDLGAPGSAERWRARGEILKGEILTASRVADAGAGLSAGLNLADDETAVMVHLTPEGALLGVVSPGDTVHVLAAFETRACLLIPRARVVAVGGRSSELSGNVSDDTLVTLAVSPKDAARTVLAARTAALSLTLLSPLSTGAPPKCVSAGDL